MTRRRIVYQRPDGGVSVVVPSPRYVAALMTEGETEASAVAMVMAKDAPELVPDRDPRTGEPKRDEQGDIIMVPFAMDRRVTVDTSIPADRTFRDAWRRDGTRPIRVDMPAARVIHRQRLEQRAAERARVLREQYLEADEDGDAARAQQLRQRARGMRQRIGALGPTLDAAQTPEELAAITDDELAEPDDHQPQRGAR